MFITKTHNLYPDKPFFYGNLNKNNFNNTVAVVGSRKMTTYGKKATEEIVKELKTLTSLVKKIDKRSAEIQSKVVKEEWAE